ncbi:hypothetical protein BMH52_19715 [Pseudomonas sp. BTN1]|nr:hypothetical protein BMH52_19715 [Pseudomonas sp. BTN1]
MCHIDSNGRVGRYHVARDFTRIGEFGVVQFFQPSDDGAMRAKVGHQDVGLLVASDQEITAPATPGYLALTSFSGSPSI